MFHVKQFKIMNKIVYISLIISILACTTNSIVKKSENGDLLFIEAKKENFSGAISRVTKTNENNISFDHVIFIQKKENKLFALHASTENGSEKIPLIPLLKKYHKEKRRQVLYRIIEENCRNKSIINAEKLLGKPYNYSFYQNENSFYCSDFVERATRDCKIFALIPMKFKNPATGKIDNYWLEYYKKIGIDVPEGKPGTNPNDLSKSKNIQKIKVY